MKDNPGYKNINDKWLGYCLGAISFLMIAYHFYYIWDLPYEPSIHAIAHLGFAFVILAGTGLKKKFNIQHLIVLVASLFVTYYFLDQYESILDNPSYPPEAALLCGIVAFILVISLTWECFGLVFPCITLIGVLYAAFGSYLPDWISAPPMDFERLVTLLAADVTSPWGAYGSLLILSANYLFLFIFFGSALEAFGGMRFIMEVGKLAAAKFRSGAAALSVITSALLGSLTGSTTANITITGSFTIPMMKKSGYSPEQAAAIETAASSGGQILPPIMGATVFLMAGFTGIPYIEVAKACFIPAVIYFLAVLLYAELNARKLNIKSTDKPKIDKLNLLLDAPVFFVPLGLLLVLLIMGFSLMLTIVICIVAVAVLGQLTGLRKSARLDWKNVGVKLMAGIHTGCQIAVVLSLIGVLVASIEISGLGMRLGNILVMLGEHNLLLLLLLTAVTGVILGVGLPTPAAYIICATMLSPAMMKLGVPMLQAHLFPLYFAVFSHLTPPVGIGMMVASKMAGSNYIKSAIEGIRAAISSFLLPFFFIYAPSILLKGHGFAPGLIDFISVVSSVLILSILMVGYWKNKINSIQKIIFMVSLLLFFMTLFATNSIYMLLASLIVMFIGLILNHRMDSTYHIRTAS